MTPRDILQQLRSLDASSLGFPDRLSNILYGEEYRQSAPNLQGDHLDGLVDYMDKALDVLDPCGPAFRTCLRELINICGIRAILPTSYKLTGSLHGVGSLPFTPGGFGEVYEGILDGERVSIKRVRMYSSKGDPETAAKALYQEAVVWKRLKHPSIVPFLGVAPIPLQLVSEHMTGGGLAEYIKRDPDTDRLGLLSDIAEGLCYLHSCNVIHGDLKGPNILVDAAGHARITGFGHATVARNRDSTESGPNDQGLITQWLAPEILYGDNGSYSKPADIFSFAMVMIEVFSGAVPFNNLSAAVAVFAIIEGRRPLRPSHPTFTDELWALARRCWDQDPHLRPEASEALKVLCGTQPPAWKRLISDALNTQERVSLITGIFSEQNGLEVAKQLHGEDAQAFVDVIDKELGSLEPPVRKRCMDYLSDICGRQALIPRSLKVELQSDQKVHPSCSGEFGYVWRGRHSGGEVAVKVLTVCLTSDIEQIRKRFCEEVVMWKGLRHPNVLPLLGVMMTETRFAVISEWMANGNVNEFMKERPDADRLLLTQDVARGLYHMHDQGIVHGDLKGTNILIRHTGRACLADFGLSTIVPVRSNLLSLRMERGTTRWMSPELLDPGRFGLEESRPTKESDCYALGMVIYEILAGLKPYAPNQDSALARKVLEGERPGRPRGDRGRLFTDGIWITVQLCWKPQPSDRINAKSVLLNLEGDPPSSRSSMGGYAEKDVYGQSGTSLDAYSLPVKCCSEELVASPQRPRRPVGRLARNARKTFKVITRKFCGS